VVRLFPELTFDEQGVERLAEHITRFSLAAIKNYHGQDRGGLRPEPGPGVAATPAGQDRP
jgi:hypothetical protein